MRLRLLEPALDPEFDHWLTFLGGTNGELLRTWMRCAATPFCATPLLVLGGPKRSGKTLFARGMARLWTTEGPTDIDDTHRIRTCPLVVADEELNERIVDAVVTMRSSSVEARSEVRVIYTTNTPFSLPRVVEENTVAVRFWSALPPFEQSTLERWVEGDGIARHALALRADAPSKAHS